ncbi:MAG: hypothetical protein FWF79_01960, partial [Defluviitaleaceae bacterium]|nr:hypothetical protein [Defluviitaleaceae bacterium]
TNAYFAVSGEHAGYIISVRVSRLDAIGYLYAVLDNGKTVPFDIVLEMQGNSHGDDLVFSDFSSNFGRAGDEITLSYNLGDGGGFDKSRIIFSHEIPEVTQRGAGTRNFTLTNADTHAASNGIITITATFSHENLIPRTPVFALGDNLTKIFGHANFFNMLLLNGEIPGEYDGMIAFSSNNPDVATVDYTTGEVKITGIGTALITAEISATETHAAAASSFTLIVIPDPKHLENYLSALIAYAENLLQNTRESIDGSDIPYAMFWAAEEARYEFYIKIRTARNTLSN